LETNKSVCDTFGLEIIKSVQNSCGVNKLSSVTEVEANKMLQISVHINKFVAIGIR
jgi:hypothetical protein